MDLIAFSIFFLVSCRVTRILHLRLFLLFSSDFPSFFSHAWPWATFFLRFFSLQLCHFQFELIYFATIPPTLLGYHRLHRIFAFQTFFPRLLKPGFISMRYRSYHLIPLPHYKSLRNVLSHLLRALVPPICAIYCSVFSSFFVRWFLWLVPVPWVCIAGQIHVYRMHVRT